MNAKYLQRLPQLADKLFLTDGGIETTLIYQDGINLPFFAAFDLLRDAAGREALERYYRSHAAIARTHGTGFVLESATWRASADWGAKLGYNAAMLATANRQAIAMLHPLRDEFDHPDTPVVISGCVGPRGDGYKVEARMTPEEAEAYHSIQIRTLAIAGADMITAITMTYAEEATGVVRAARTAGMPVAIAFTTETDGRLPSGQPLAEAITQVDGATGGGPAYYMINCAHPTHFMDKLTEGTAWVQRIRGIRANASTRSHAELDVCTTLDAGNPWELARQYAELRQRFPHFAVLGGCCGTDCRHIHAIGHTCVRAHPIMLH